MNAKKEERKEEGDSKGKVGKQQENSKNNTFSYVHFDKGARPEPVLVDNAPEFEVEEILAQKTKAGNIWYKVKWKGYPRDEATWEPATNLKNATKVLQAYHRRS